MKLKPIIFATLFIFFLFVIVWLSIKTPLLFLGVLVVVIWVSLYLIFNMFDI